MFLAICCLYMWFYIKQEKVDHPQAETFVALGNDAIGQSRMWTNKKIHVQLAKDVSYISDISYLSHIYLILLYAIAKIAIITARIILHLISYPQFTYDLFHMHQSPTYLSREHMNPKLTCSQRQWLYSSVGRASHRYREVTGSSLFEVLNFFQASLRNCI